MDFRLAPFGSPQLRALRKDRKHYHFDWTAVPSRGPRFENLVACHLLKWVHFRQDTEGLDYELRYFRDRDGREVDFVVTNRGAPVRYNLHRKERPALPLQGIRKEYESESVRKIEWQL